MSDQSQPFNSIKKVRVAHVLPWPTVGGTELATSRITRSVDADKFEHVAFHTPEAGPVAEIFNNDGIDTVEYVPPVHSFRHFFPYYKQSRALARKFLENRVDLVHCSDMLAGYYGGLAGRLAGLTVLCHVRSGGGTFAEISKRDQTFLRLIHHFAFVSKDTWRTFGFPVPERKGTVIYDGFDLTAPSVLADKKKICEEWGIPSNAKIVGTVARVAEQKDYFTLTRAAARIVSEHPNIRFLVVGDHSGTENYRGHFEEVKQYLNETRMSDYFVFTGHQENVNDFLSAMDVFVLSTHSEGLPLVIIEAMAQGKPVVATRVGGIPEIVSDGRTGFIHEHEDDKTFADQVLSLLNDPSLGERIGSTARKEIAANWTRERFGNDISSLYQKLIPIPR